MSTPTTIKCQIAVPSDGNGVAEKIDNLTLSLLVEGSPDDGEIQVKFLSSEEVTPLGIVPPPKDPPVTTEINAELN